MAENKEEYLIEKFIKYIFNNNGLFPFLGISEEDWFPFFKDNEKNLFDIFNNYDIFKKYVYNNYIRNYYNQYYYYIKREFNEYIKKNFPITEIIVKLYSIKLLISKYTTIINMILNYY